MRRNALWRRIFNAENVLQGALWHPNPGGQATSPFAKLALATLLNRGGVQPAAQQLVGVFGLPTIKN